MYALLRISTGKYGTFGVLMSPNAPVPLCCTLEPPWNNNQPNQSCIPEGSYICTPHSGTKYKNVWEINGVPNRDAILIHQGNKLKNTTGCVLVGKSFAVLDGEYGVKDSILALNGLRAIMPKEFTLTIKNVF